MKTRIITVIVALILISCEKRDPKLDSQLNQLEKQAAEAIERQRQLEMELAEQKILAERDAIERERTMIEQERVAMEEAKNADSAAALADLMRRQEELMERDRKISETQRELMDREQELTGLEAKLSERELDLAGREPLEALPPIEKNYVSAPTGDYNNFYEPLAAYGSWFQTTDYGYVYQPAVVRDGSWRPYTRGRWAFTNHGWTWVSSEPFGWACYHYGRWSLLRNIGWVWIPGNQWAPAWVTWRESPGHIGWAPLPPETLAWSSNSWDSSVDVRYGIDSGWFSFISYNNFGNDIYRHCLPYSQNIVIYQTTTTVTHYVIQDRRVYCGGPRYRNVCDRIGRRFPIHQLRLDHSPDFGRGGRRLNSQFSGNELQVVAPRMDADWNRALRPSRISRDLGEVVVDRSKELPEDVRKQYRDRRIEEDEKAQRWVANTGSRDAFENDRKTRLEKNREEVVKSESLNRNAREPRSESNKKVERPNPPVVTDTTDLPSDKTKRPHTRDSKRPIPETPTITDPEIPVTPDKKTTGTPYPEKPVGPDKKTTATPYPEKPVGPDKKTTGSPYPEKPVGSDKKTTATPYPEKPVAPDTKTPTIPNVPDTKLDENHQEKSKRSDLPRGVIPTPPVTDNNLVPNRLVEPPVRSDRPHIDDTSKRPQSPSNKDTNLQSEIDKKAARELLLQQEQQQVIARQQELENRKAQQKQEQLEQAQRQMQEKQEKLDQQLDQTERAREQKEQTEKLREQQEKQELANKEQQERLRAQQEQRDQAREQQNQLREQQAQQELARKQQEETQGRLKQQQEQQEKMRAQQEQQERARQQQAEAQSRMQEQQEKMRAQQEQQERARQQQEQQEKQRAQQEQQERMRAQQEQQERARQQQEQQERQRAQQEQQRAQQEQQERARQQQEENQRRK